MELLFPFFINKFFETNFIIAGQLKNKGINKYKLAFFINHDIVGTNCLVPVFQVIQKVKSSNNVIDHSENFYFLVEYIGYFPLLIWQSINLLIVIQFNLCTKFQRLFPDSSPFFLKNLFQCALTILEIDIHCISISTCVKIVHPHQSRICRSTVFHLISEDSEQSWDFGISTRVFDNSQMLLQRFYILES